MLFTFVDYNRPKPSIVPLSSISVDIEKGSVYAEDGVKLVSQTPATRWPSKDSVPPLASWMSKIHSATLVSALTLPGTHDSAAYTLAWPFVQTQTLSIGEQLAAGIRYLDLRCGLRDNQLEMVHGPGRLGLTLLEVFEAVYTWLEQNPSEGVVIQLKEDRKAERSTINFAQAVVKCISAKSERWLTANETPTMGELRGKIQLFRRFTEPDLNAYGIDVTRWQDNPLEPFTIYTQHNVQITIQDHYSFTDPQPLASLIAAKGGDVSGLLRRAAADPDLAHWFMNFTSAYEFNVWHQLSPKDVAVGAYSGFRWEDGMNPRLRQFLRDLPSSQRLGIVAMDFPVTGTADLIEALIATNFKSKSHRFGSGFWGLTAVTIFVLILICINWYIFEKQFLEWTRIAVQ